MCPWFESRWHHEEERFKPLFFVLDVMSYLLGMEHCINAAVIIAPGMPTNIGTSTLRMPQRYKATNINAVVISPQKATRPVFLGFIFLRSFSDSTLIKSGRNSTNTAHNAIIPATNKITITASKFQFEDHSTTTAKVILRLSSKHSNPNATHTAIR